MPLDAGGDFKIDKVREDTFARLARAVDARRGNSTAAPLSSSSTFDGEFTVDAAAGILKLEGVAAGMAVAGIYKCDARLAREVMEYTDDELQLCAPPFAAVVNQYAPDWLKKHAALATFAGVLSTITIQKLQHLNQLLEKYPAAVNRTPSAGSVTIPVSAGSGGGAPVN